MEPRANDKVKGIFQGAPEQSSPALRDEYVAQACARDAALRQRVDELLRAHDQADSLLDRPAAELLAGETDGDAAAPDDWLDFLEPPTKPGSLGRLGHYEILEVAGRGGMGIVFRAFDDKLQRVVAIKALSPALASSPKSRQQFVREARAAAAVTHENVIAIYGVEDGGPAPYLVMQFIDGTSLEDKIERTGPLPLKAILRIALHIAEGLAAAHRQGLVHRDVKPANILLENGVERVKITDFGLARAGDDATLTVSGLLTGTPTYMSPEQAQGEPVDFTSDLFSLGGVIYAMCTGEAPFRGASTLAVLKRVCEGSPRPIREVNAELPDWLAELVARLHAKSPADRPASAREVADLLAWRLAELQDGGKPSSAPPPPPPQPPARGRRWLTAAAVPLALLAVLVVTEATGLTNIRFGLTPIPSSGGDETPQANVPPQPAPPVTTGATAVLSDAEWEQTLVGLPPADQAKAVAARLMALNPKFGGLYTHKSVGGEVIDFRFSSERVSNIKPLRALRKLSVLHCAGSERTRSPLVDLSPLKGMRLEVLLCPETSVADLSVVAGMPMLALDVKNTDVSDLAPVKGMSLIHLVISNSRVSDLSPIRGMPLGLLVAEDIAVSDVSPLAGMPLKHLGLYRTRVSNLSPLRGLPLEYLNLTALPISDLSLLAEIKTLRRLVLDELPVTTLSAIKGLPLEALQIQGTPVSDLSPIEGMPLKSISLDFQPARDAATLRSIRSLERINRLPAAEFWKRQEK